MIIVNNKFLVIKVIHALRKILVLGAVVKKSLSTRTHVCACGCRLGRDENAAINILNRALGTVGHTGTWILDPNA
ncbi:MAG: zinc ribbon domain-containing protein [Crocosphaera sp.]